MQLEVVCITHVEYLFPKQRIYLTLFVDTEELLSEQGSLFNKH